MNRFLLLIPLLLFSPNAHSLEELTPYQAISKVSERATVCGKVSSIKYSVSSNQRPTFINLGPEFPSHVFTIVIWGDVRDSLKNKPESLANRKICITGLITKYKGKAQIELNNENQIKGY
jgi:DNA/RNA endonuclease YhcR with UshA esterase domain